MRIVTGCDVVDIDRLSAVADRRAGFVARVFTPAEVADCSRGGVALDSPTGRARLAARFAAKEAARKATGDLRLPFHAVEVRRAAGGAPQLHLHGRPTTWSCSLSHDGGVAFAVVVGLADGAADGDVGGDAHPTDPAGAPTTASRTPSSTSPSTSPST